MRFVDVPVKLYYFVIFSGREHNFNKKTQQVVTGLGLPYDYDGLMHYGAYAFAKDRSKPTIVKIKNTGGSIGQRKGFSATDLKQINLLYDCQSKYVFDFIITLLRLEWSLNFQTILLLQSLPKLLGTPHISEI